MAVVSCNDESVECLVGSSVDLGVDEVLKDVLVIGDAAVVFVFWPKGINFGVIGARVVNLVLISLTSSFIGSVEDSTTLVVFVLAPKGIPTELPMASGGLII